MGKAWTDTKTNYDTGEKWEDDLPFEFEDIRDVGNNMTPVRLVGYVQPFSRVWVPVEADKAYDPYKTKVKQYPAVCSDFDPTEEEYVRNDCYYRKARFPVIDDDGNRKWAKLKPSKNFLIFYINRSNQEDSTGIPLRKKLQDAKRSDIKCTTVPMAFAKAVKSAMDFMTKKNGGKTIDPTDPDYGYDLFFAFDKSANAEAKYKIQCGDVTPLTDEEREQVTALIPREVRIFPKNEPDRIKESLLRAGYVIVEGDEDPEEIFLARTSKKSAGASRPAMRKPAANLVDDDEDEEDEAPKAKASKVVVKKAPKPADEEDFEDEDNDLGLSARKAADTSEEEEEEDSPVSRAIAAKAAARAAKVVKAAPAKARQVIEDDEDDPIEDDDFSDEDEN